MSNVMEDILEIMAFPWPELENAKTEKTVQEMLEEVPPSRYKITTGDAPHCAYSTRNSWKRTSHPNVRRKCTRAV